MHNIEPAHHALQQEGGFEKGKELKHPITRVIRKFIWTKKKNCYYGTVACNCQHNQIIQQHSDQSELVSSEE